MAFLSNSEWKALIVLKVVFKSYLETEDLKIVGSSYSLNSCTGSIWDWIKFEARFNTYLKFESEFL